MPYPTTSSSEYQVFPRIVPEAWSGNLVLDGEYRHTRFVDGVEYSYELRATYFNATGRRQKGKLSGSATVDQDGKLVIPFSPDVAGEWQLTVSAEKVRSRHLPCRMGLFVQPARWYAYRPYIGELHSHSTGSDGGQEPAYGPIRGRSFGMDFYALTDHRNFHPSLEMRERIGKALGGRMVLLLGEELHPEVSDLGEDGTPPVHCHPYHYVSVGQRQSVRDACLVDSQAAQAAIRAIEEELQRRGVDPDLDVRGYAEGVWKVRKAKELGGTVIFAHPYWGAWPLNLDRASIDQSFLDREAHAVEAISRADPSSLMANKLVELAAAGIRYPLVGVSDGHNWGPEAPFSYCTLVMADALSQDAILEGIRAGRCVACRLGDPPLYLGPFELIEFTGFYLENILPLKRKHTLLQAHLAFSYLAGGPFDQGLIQRIDAELASLEERLWAAPERPGN